MNSREFYKKFNDKVKDLSKEQIADFLNNLIRKIPESKYEEVINMFNTNNSVDIESIEDAINGYEEKFNLIDNFELYFHATGYEDYEEYYSPWGGEWVWEYTDDENVGDLIEEATFYAIDLVNNKKYKEAKKLLDIILYTNYQVLDDDGGNIFEISLNELKENGLISIDVYTLCLYAIYATYQSISSKARVPKIYGYFKNENFKDISIEDSFKLGTEILKGLDEFWDNWINLLANSQGKIEYRLLKEAFEYVSYSNYKKYIKMIAKNQPKIFIDIFNFLSKNNNIEEIISIGNEALLLIDKNVTVRNDIALYLAKYDEDNKEKYIIEAFKSNTNVPNLIRIINNGYYLKYIDLINEIIVYDDNTTKSLFGLGQNKIDKNTYHYLNFFLGKFDEFYEESLKYKSSLGWSNSFIETAIYLWLLVLNEKNNSKLYVSILSNIFDRLGFKENLLFLDDNYELIFRKWKENFTINNNNYLKWLEKVIDKRVDAIVSGSHRGSYFKAAELVVALGEVLESNNITTKDEFVNIYHQKYIRRSSFRKELNKYNSKELN